MIISKGRLVACDTPENLEQLFAGRTTVELTLEAEPEEATQLLEPLEHIRAAKPILRMTTVKASLEDVFIELTSDEPEPPCSAGSGIPGGAGAGERAGA